MKWVNRCLTSLRNSDVPLDVLVIDNGSKDGTQDTIRKQFPEVRLKEMTQNLGFAGGNNLGFADAIENGYEFIFLLNQDTWILPNTVKVLLNELKSDVRIGIVSPVQLTGKGDQLDPNFSSYINNKNLIDLKNDLLNKRIESVGFVNAAAWLMPISLVRKIGGFDALFPHYGEDRDYCNRITYHGYRVHIVLNSLLHHDRNYSDQNPYRKIYNLTFTMGLAHVKNINQGLLKNYTTWLYWRFRKLIRAIMVFDSNRLLVEAKVILNLIRMNSEIRLSRKKSKTLEAPFLQ